MSIIAFDHLSPAERLELIGELWESLDDTEIPLTKAQKDELDRRLKTADDDLAEDIPWEDLRAEIARR